MKAINITSKIGFLISLFMLVSLLLPTSVSAQSSSHTNEQLWEIAMREYTKARQAEEDGKRKEAYSAWKQALAYVNAYKQRNPVQILNDNNHAMNVQTVYVNSSKKVIAYEHQCLQYGIPCPPTFNGGGSPGTSPNGGGLVNPPPNPDCGGIVHEEANVIGGDCDDGGIILDEPPPLYLERVDLFDESQLWFPIEECIPLEPEPFTYDGDLPSFIENIITPNFRWAVNTRFASCNLDGTIDYNFVNP